jgi:cell division septal protein FtsQ
MPLAPRKTRRKPWTAWARFGAVLAAVAAAGWGALELGQRYLGVQKLVVEQISVSGCQWDRLAEVQGIADEACRGKPLFLFDADALQKRIESLRWVRAVLIRREPPDRLSIVIEERQPLFVLIANGDALLMSEDGVIMNRVNQANIRPVPVVAGPCARDERAVVRLIAAARALKSQQPDFFARLSEIRWSDRGPVAFMEGLQAPIYLSKDDPAKNIPNFQALFLQMYANRPNLDNVQYFDLRWDDQIPVRLLGGAE